LPFDKSGIRGIPESHVGRNERQHEINTRKGGSKSKGTKGKHKKQTKSN
jgi:hypothetical protein